MRSPETSCDRARLLVHLAQRLVVGRRGRAARRSAARARAAAGPPRSCAARRCGAARRSRSPRPSNGSTSSPSASRRAIALIVKSRRARSSSTVAAGSTTISKSWRPGPGRSLAPRRRELDAGGSERANRAVARVEAHARPAGPRRRDPRPARAARAARAAPRCRRRATRKSASFDSSPSSSSRTAPPTRYASSPSERDVVLDGLQHASQPVSAIASISTSAPEGSFATSTVERAGGVLADVPRVDLVHGARSRRGSAGRPSSSRSGRATSRPPRGSLAGSRTPARSAP